MLSKRRSYQIDGKDTGPLTELEYQNLKEFTKMRDTYWNKPDKGAESELEIIISGHLFFEKTINNIIDAIFPIKTDITNSSGKFDIHNKILIIEGLDIFEHDTITKMKKFNTLRNKYSHNLHFRCELNQINQIFPTDPIDWKHNRINCIRLATSATCGIMETTRSRFMYLKSINKMYKFDNLLEAKF